MPQEFTMRELLNNWEPVWHEGRYELISECLRPVYTRHDPFPTAYTPDEYGRVIVDGRERCPDIRFAVYDHAFVGDRAWLRGTMQRTDPPTGQPGTRAYIQVYRVEAGKLAETWLAWREEGSAWSDAIAQEHWTSTRARE